MKVHYINILFFALPLNILVTLSHVNTQKKPHTPHHTRTIRLLCECELYEPANYDNDPQMKKVMENFNKQTQQRFDEYDERMKTTRQQCKERCDKEIQKIILKDKLEKQMAQQFATLHTDIQSDAIPTCVCEKSIADKVEKGCLRCGYGLGGALTSWEILGYTGIYGWANFATAIAPQAGVKAGIKIAIEYLEDIPGLSSLPGFKLENIINPTNYSSGSLITTAIDAATKPICEIKRTLALAYCNFSNNRGAEMLTSSAKNAAELGVQKAAAVTNEKITEVTTTIGNSSNVMIASGIAILIIVLIVIIIYLILRYRRKKKMKKKLQYIKLLKE
ncbi:rifin PIR protein, putative [Plasmodium reichenowi]|uniref:Rifin PIR protein, putative n=1 Tax=Plasmodium reichenowi TaxID=5854 RepID=A0A2P9DBE0_PLARE|nr:rifin PIR protein, putative [Plasmodium reichenowi]